MCLVVGANKAVFTNGLPNFKVTSLRQVFVEERVNGDIANIASVKEVHLPSGAMAVNNYLYECACYGVHKPLNHDSADGLCALSSHKAFVEVIDFTLAPGIGKDEVSLTTSRPNLLKLGVNSSASQSRT